MAIAVHFCQSKQQDEIHGRSLRVVNPVGKSYQNGTYHRYRCTVCGGEVEKAQVLSGHGK